ncbi:hypothetical protein GCM10010196_13240 [Agromyces mediolanus]|uniref:Uncharacterized protein n=1 Tax=Agromyces mediolanus TaxID=41986 RepID=A0A918CF36_AGRME|nr:hypothetical protein GCM10010196_13240 [Agromyces mediolanus]
MFALASMMRLPTGVEPVNMILPTFGLFVSASPTVRPGPATMFSTPAGSTSFMTATRASPESVVVSAGFATTVLPIRSEGAICQIAIIIGQFHGEIAPTTPIGR